MTNTRRLVPQLLLVPLVAIATSGCFATRTDMRVLQGDILSKAEVQEVASLLPGESEGCPLRNTFLFPYPFRCAAAKGSGAARRSPGPSIVTTRQRRR